MFDLSSIVFRQAANYKPGPRRGGINLLVIHTAEVPRVTGMARRLMDNCATTPEMKSWHYAVDRDEVTQSVKIEDIAWHAPGANANGIGVELAARASQTLADWEDDYSVAQLGLVAELFAALATNLNIPIAYVNAAGLLAGARGITTHAQVSLAFKKSTHTDPGASFPMDEFITLVSVTASAPSPVS